MLLIERPVAVTLTQHRSSELGHAGGDCHACGGHGGIHAGGCHMGGGGGALQIGGGGGGAHACRGGGHFSHGGPSSTHPTLPSTASSPSSPHCPPGLCSGVFPAVVGEALTPLPDYRAVSPCCIPASFNATHLPSLVGGLPTHSLPPSPQLLRPRRRFRFTRSSHQSALALCCVCW